MFASDLRHGAPGGRGRCSTRQLHREYGDVVRFKVGVNWWNLVVHPDDIWDVCVKRQKIFWKPKLVKRLLKHGV